MPSGPQPPGAALGRFVPPGLVPPHLLPQAAAGAHAYAPAAHADAYAFAPGGGGYAQPQHGRAVAPQPLTFLAAPGNAAAAFAAAMGTAAAGGAAQLSMPLGRRATGPDGQELMEMLAAAPPPGAPR